MFIKMLSYLSPKIKWTLIPVPVSSFSNYFNISLHNKLNLGSIPTF